jgi:hypothetical protein
MSDHRDAIQPANGPDPSIKWQQASQCADGSCVQIGQLGGRDIVLIRDSKDVDGGTISCTTTEFRALVAEIKAGTFDLPR